MAAACLLSVGLACAAVAAETTRVDLARPHQIAIHPERSAPATVISLNDTEVSAEIAARVVELPVRVGDIIAADGLLVALDCQDYKLTQREYGARLEGIQARIELAQKRLRRTEELMRKRTVSEELLDERESELAVLHADLRAARTTLEQAKVDVTRCTVNSPFRALVTERLSAVGQYANVGTALVRILELDDLEVSAQVFSEDVQQVQERQQISFENSGHRYPTRLRTILPSVNTRTRNREVRLLFVDGPALPGAAGKIFWTDP